MKRRMRKARGRGEGKGNTERGGGKRIAATDDR